MQGVTASFDAEEDEGPEEQLESGLVAAGGGASSEEMSEHDSLVELLL